MASFSELIRDEWNRRHSFCPKCHGVRVGQSYAGQTVKVIRTEDNGCYKVETVLTDDNKADCGDCGWSGNVSDLSPSSSPPESDRSDSDQVS